MSNVTIKVEVSGLSEMAKAIELLAVTLKGAPHASINIDTTKQRKLPETEATAAVEALPTLQDVQKAFKNKATPQNKQHMQEIIQHFGATKLSEVEPKDYPALLKEMELVN